jgi:tetratricopeptide (TPR) repeat protein
MHPTRAFSRSAFHILLSGTVAWAGFFLLNGCVRTDSQIDDVQQVLGQARDQIKIFNFHVAQPLFEELVVEFEKGSDDWSESMIGLALSSWHRSPNGPAHVGKSRDVLNELIAEEQVGGRFKAEATFMLGRIAEVIDYPADEVDLNEARKRYLEVIRNWPDEPVAREAGLRLGVTYLQEHRSPEKVREGIAILQQWLEKYPGDAAGSLAARLIGDAYHLSLEDPDSALPWYLRAVEAGLLNTARAGNFYWLVASLAEEKDRDVDVAVRFYQRIITETPRSGRAFEAQLRLADMQKRFPDRQIAIPEIPMYQNRKDETSAGAPAPGTSSAVSGEDEAL